MEQVIDLKNKKIHKNAKPFGVASATRLFYYKKKEAYKREIKWNINLKEFLELTSQNCYYCGAEPLNYSKRKGGNGGYYYNGLDRIDSNGPYELWNIKPCCKWCNFAKNAMTTEEFLNWVKKIYNYQRLGN